MDVSCARTGFNKTPSEKIPVYTKRHRMCSEQSCRMNAISGRPARVASLILLTFLRYPVSVHGRPHRVTQILNGEVFSCATCHVRPEGGDNRNAFGQTVESEFRSSVSDSGNVLWGPELALRDSDGDEFTNGEELCDPDGRGVPHSSVGVTSPGDATVFPMVAFGASSRPQRRRGRR